ncbi:MAG: hypothetical protein O7G30_10685 [Proteobacteria bacterium]|nr:hypothetical protein [Pseudomonadota bacterium]
MLFTPPVAADPPEPAICQAAIAAQPHDPLAALQRAEVARWQAARTASRQGRHLMRQTMGGGTSLATRRLANQIAQAQDAYRVAVQQARVLCGCRERRGDPYREDCDALFRNLEVRGILGPS